MAQLPSFEEYLRLHEVTLTGGQRLDPKRFDKDLTRALNGVKGYSNFQSRSAEILAHKIAINLRALGIRGDAVLLSGRNSMSNLSSLYREYGVKNGESRADVRIGNMRCSLKYAKHAALATAEANETRAVFAAACQHLPKYQELIQQQLLPLVQQTMTAQMFQKLRAAYDATSPTAFQTMLSRIMGLHSGHTAPTTKERTAFQQFLNHAGILLPIRAELATFLGAAETKRAVFREFASGQYRFSRPEYSATHMILWDETGRVSCAPIDEYIESHLHRFTYSIRSAHNAAALRIDVAEAWQLPADLVALCDTWAVKESANLPLNEHLLGDLWQQFVMVVKQILAFMLHLLRGGIVSVSEFFGYEIERLAWTSTF
jgi:hypothetical protein